MEDKRKAGSRPLKPMEFVIPALALPFVVYYVISIWGLPWEAQLNGMFLATALVVLLGLFALRVATGLARGTVHVELTAPGRSWADNRKRLAVLGLTVLYLAMLQWLGFTASTFIFLLLAMRVLGVPSWPRGLSIAGVMSVAGYLLFIAGLNAPFPEGVVEHLVEALLG